MALEREHPTGPGANHDRREHEEADRQARMPWRCDVSAAGVVRECFRLRIRSHHQDPPANRK